MKNIVIIIHKIIKISIFPCFDNLVDFVYIFFISCTSRIDSMSNSRVHSMSLYTAIRVILGPSDDTLGGSERNTPDSSTTPQLMEKISGGGERRSKNLYIVNLIALVWFTSGT